MRTSLLLGVGILAVACGGSDDVSFGSGGSGGTSGSSQGGSSAGGSAQGGSAQGGSAQGGSSAGGNAQGGSAAGGSAAGGSAQGGSSAGGSAQGGSAGQGGTAGQAGSAQGGSAGVGGSAGATAGGAGGNAGSAGMSAGGSAGMSTGGTGGTPGTLQGLLMSEYVEGSNSNKAIEVFNGTPNPVDLTRCELVFTFAGSGNQTRLKLDSPSMGLPSKSTWVLCDADGWTMLQNRCQQPISGDVFFFNGDDTVELFCDDQLVDSLGRLGEDPGEGWGDPNSAVYTRDHTLRRKCSVTRGDTNSSDPFDPKLEWDGFGLNQFDGLGHHCGN